MITAKSFVDKQSSINNFKYKYKKWAIFFAITFLLFSAFSVYAIYMHLTWDSGPFWFCVVIAVIMLICSVICFLVVIKKYNFEKEMAVINNNVEKHSITTFFTFEKYKIIITKEQNGITNTETIPIKRVNFVENRKDSVSFFIEDRETYKILSTDFIEGQKSDLIEYFKNHMIKVMKC